MAIYFVVRDRYGDTHAHRDLGHIHENMLEAGESYQYAKIEVTEDGGAGAARLLLGEIVEPWVDAVVPKEKLKLKFYADPGHGWLRVPRWLLGDLGIEDKITGFSYQRTQWVYLEEDQDYRTFMEAAEPGNEITITQSHTNRDSSIRYYEPYQKGGAS